MNVYAKKAAQEVSSTPAVDSLCNTPCPSVDNSLYFPYCHNLDSEKGRKNVVKDLSLMSRIVRKGITDEDVMPLLNTLHNVYISIQAYGFSGTDEKDKSRLMKLMCQVLRNDIRESSAHYDATLSKLKSAAEAEDTEGMQKALDDEGWLLYQ